jgi:leader peptidase (prepilin peptidase) / N-methyltransferase
MTLAFVADGVLRPPDQRSAVVAVVVIAAMLPLVVAARIDEREHRIPNRLVLASVAPLALLAAASLLTADRGPLRAMAVGAALLAGPLLALHVVSPRAMGFGDVKAAAALGGTIGLVDPAVAVWALCLASAIAVGRGIVMRQGAVPFGSALVAAGIISIAVAVVLDSQDASWS